ncbi:hypothetical protein MalM25_37560 [Planctomycetes bacterium MalM25]|nr:hypothetical protein MalM25_37560 [Planctomycetes bacterium MalM25]
MTMPPPRDGRGQPRPPSAFRLPPSGMTLIELIVAITIVAILGALLLGVAATAGGVAREARTNSMITRLHTLLMERYDEYRTRRVELRPNAEAQLLVDTEAPNQYSDLAGVYLGGLAPQQRSAATRLAALRELMKLEMPDRWSDLIGMPLSTNPVWIDPKQAVDKDNPNRINRFTSEAPVLWGLYLRTYNRIVPGQPSGSDPHINTVTNQPNTLSDILTNQGAECLYLVIMNATGDGEARGLFKETDTGDTDGDGALEFLDGWGNPIAYLRWAPGFESDAQLSVPGLQDLYADAERDAPGSGPATVTNAILTDHSPYDLFRIDNPQTNVPGFDESNDAPSARGWRLVPLIYSLGADEESGLADGLTRTTGGATTADYFVRTNPYGVTGSNLRIGTAIDFETSADNINNHQSGSLVRTR